jgi:hypothetical protein
VAHHSTRTNLRYYDIFKSKSKLQSAHTLLNFQTLALAAMIHSGWG